MFNVNNSKWFTNFYLFLLFQYHRDEQVPKFTFRADDDAKFNNTQHILVGANNVNNIFKEIRKDKNRILTTFLTQL